MPKQTSALHILLYPYAFFMRLDLRRSLFWQANILSEQVTLVLLEIAAAISSLDATNRRYVVV